MIASALHLSKYGDRDQFMVQALGEHDEELGAVVVDRVGHNEYVRASKSCMNDLRGLQRVMSADLLLYVITNAWVDKEALNTGLGVRLYIEAARVAAGYGGAIAPHDCAAGATSAAAQRVWNSKRFGEQILRVGDVAYWTGLRKHR